MAKSASKPVELDCENCPQHEKMQFQVQTVFTMIDELKERVDEVERKANSTFTTTEVFKTQLTHISDTLVEIKDSIAKYFTETKDLVSRLEKRVKLLEDAPKRFWMPIVSAVLSGVVVGVVVYFVTAGGAK